jgi:hypothetical protein
LKEKKNKDTKKKGSSGGYKNEREARKKKTMKYKKTPNNCTF